MRTPNPFAMNGQTPICLLMDDPCPLVHVYREHWRDVHHKEPVTDDGRPLADVIPNDFLDRYCDVIERRGIKGKFSIVPAPAAKGDILRGIEGFDPQLTFEWLDTVKGRLLPFCDVCPEGITHNLAVDLVASGADSSSIPLPSSVVVLPEGESKWSQHQTRESLTPYLEIELRYLREAGFDATGVTSPWVFGIEVEQEYIAAIVEAQKRVYGRTFSWYFLHMLYDKLDARPYVAYQGADATLISIPGNIDDYFWKTINSPRTDAGFISSIVDEMLTDDGRQGAVIRILEAGGWPVLVTHWQSMFSNGLETGLAALDELGRRVQTHLSERVEWMTCSEMARLTEKEVRA